MKTGWCIYCTWLKQMV